MKRSLRLFFLISIFSLLIAFSNFYNSDVIYSQDATNRPNSSASGKPTPTPLVPEKPPESGINLTLSPTFLNLVTDPGVPVSSQLKIRNNSNVREYLKFTLATFGAEGDDGDTPVLKEVTSQDQFPKWISFSEDQFIVDPNEQKTIRFTISPPKDAALGYYYALMVQRIKEAVPGQRQTIVSGSPAFLVILEVRDPNAKRELELIKFTTSQSVYEYPPVDFKITFKNTGNIHLVPSGDIFIDWGSSKDVGVIRSNEFRGNILPQTSRTYTASWTDGFIARIPKRDKDGNLISNKNGEIEYETKWDFNKLTKLRIGRYTAHLVAVYDNGTRDIPLEGTVSFWVIPWKIIGVGLIVLVLVLFGLKSIFSSIFSRNKRR